MWAKRLLLIVALFCERNVASTISYDVYPEYPDEISKQYSNTSSDVEMRVMRGKDAEPGEFPHQAYFSHKKDGKEHMCSASIIDPLLLLTAAHCALVNDINLTPDLIDLVTGEHDLSRNDTTEKHHRVRSVIIHDRYNATTHANDIAILVLKDAIKFDNFTKLIKIPNPGQDLPGWAYISGWGSLGNETTSKVLQKAKVALVNMERCRSDYTGYNLKDGMICAGGTGDRDVCEGDSGGPLTCDDSKGEKFLCGIISWGYLCEDKIERGLRKPGVYTDVRKYHGWIQKHMRVRWGHYWIIQGIDWAMKASKEARAMITTVRKSVTAKKSAGEVQHGKS